MYIKNNTTTKQTNLKYSISKMDPLGRLCNNCNYTFTKTKKCSGCNSARYCSTECQKIGWNTHKTICKEIEHRLNLGSKKEIDMCNYCGDGCLNLLSCGICKQVKYCSKKCQMENWTNHKFMCNNQMLSRNVLISNQFCKAFIKAISEDSCELLHNLLCKYKNKYIEFKYNELVTDVMSSEMFNKHLVYSMNNMYVQVKSKFTFTVIKGREKKYTNRMSLKKLLGEQVKDSISIMLLYEISNTNTSLNLIEYTKALSIILD